MAVTKLAELRPDIAHPRLRHPLLAASQYAGLPAIAPRVLHVITPSRMAGAETFLARLLRRGSKATGIHSCITKPGPAEAEMLAAGMEIERLRIGGKANLLAVPRLARAARRHQAELLHSHLSSASWWCGWLEQLGGPASIGHVHGFTSARWHRHQRHLIACSQAVKKDLIAKGIAAERITVMHYPVDPHDMRPARLPADVRREFGVGPETPVVGAFAHLSPKKGYRELVRAAAFVLSALPRAQFWCFGDGPLREELKQTACELGIADRFRLLGFRRDVPDLMHAIDVMCLPSHREPFGLVYIEAALAGKPVIACGAGGAPEIIAHGETGLLVPPPVPTRQSSPPSSVAADSSLTASNATAIADAVFTLLDNRDAATAMGQRGHDLALERFGWSEYLRRLNDVYDSALSR